MVRVSRAGRWGQIRVRVTIVLELWLDKGQDGGCIST